MATNLEIISDALRDAGILSEVEEPTADQSATAIRTMNDLVNQWNLDGLELDYFTQSSASDDSPLPRWAIGAVKYNLAVVIAGKYGIGISPEIAEFARTGYDSLVRRTIDPQEASMDHLPGSNRYGYTISDG